MAIKFYPEGYEPEHVLVNNPLSSAEFLIPAGDWEYKAALNDTWDEAYPAGNVVLSLAADTAVKFYYDDDTNWVTDNVNSVIATAAGSFQAQLGCPGDWQPDCPATHRE